MPFSRSGYLSSLGKTVQRGVLFGCDGRFGWSETSKQSVSRGLVVEQLKRDLLRVPLSI
jgi:hypothetical protein